MHSVPTRVWKLLGSSLVPTLTASWIKDQNTLGRQLPGGGGGGGAGSVTRVGPGRPELTLVLPHVLFRQHLTQMRVWWSEPQSIFRQNQKRRFKKTRSTARANMPFRDGRQFEAGRRVDCGSGCFFTHVPIPTRHGETVLPLTGLLQLVPLKYQLLQRTYTSLNWLPAAPQVNYCSELD